MNEFWKRHGEAMVASVATAIITGVGAATLTAAYYVNAGKAETNAFDDAINAAHDQLMGIAKEGGRVESRMQEYDAHTNRIKQLIPVIETAGSLANGEVSKIIDLLKSDKDFRESVATSANDVIIQLTARCDSLQNELNNISIRTKHISQSGDRTIIKGGLKIEDNNTAGYLDLRNFGSSEIRSFDKNGRPTSVATVKPVDK